MDVISETAGIVSNVTVAVGDNVEVGAVIATIEAGSGSAAKAATTPAPAAKEAKPATANEPDASITL